MGANGAACCSGFEIGKLHLMANKGTSLKAICTCRKRCEESVRIRAKLDNC